MGPQIAPQRSGREDAFSKVRSEFPPGALFGALLEPSWAILALPEALLGPSWDRLGPSQGRLDAILGRL